MRREMMMRRQLCYSDVIFSPFFMIARKEVKF